MEIGAVGQSSAKLTGVNTQSADAIRDRLLRKSIDEYVGLTFYGPMLKMMRNSAIKGKFGHGGRGEEVFQSQLDMELAGRAGKASQSSLTEAIYKRMKRGSDAQHRVGSDVNVGEPVRSEDLLGQLRSRNDLGVGGLS